MAVKERPIPFSPAMVRAILEGRKTQTRRVVKPQPVHTNGGYFWPARKGWKIAWAAEDSAAAQLPGFNVEPPTDWFIENGKCRYGKPGNRLWVRETWAVDKAWDHLSPKQLPEKAYQAITYHGTDESFVNPLLDYTIGKTRQSIFMTRKASRIQLEITNIRVERLQDISEEDAQAEGIRGNETSEWGAEGLIEDFLTLWESINGDGSWDQNPWVWVIEFKVVAP